ncbi:putative membrane protein [Brucella rhizosphaerae]|uniref:Putative membrane protein n=1 Tax=Brucella rhizosphaerae TaxID=571254 RepID=A0A256F5U0_9HYPH|nr:putative membrane protein [Brucella rhizosphaerae]
MHAIAVLFAQAPLIPFFALFLVIPAKDLGYLSALIRSR